jgi:uncharacterized protein YlzI (FlbEa/FlbD family)
LREEILAQLENFTGKTTMAISMDLNDLVLPNQDLIDQLYDLDTQLLDHMSGKKLLSKEEIDAVQAQTRKVEAELRTRHGE